MPLVNLADNPELFANMQKYCKEKDGTEFLIRDDADWHMYAASWLYAKEILNRDIENEKQARALLLDSAKGKNCSGKGVKVQKIIRKGSIRYDQIDALQGMDLEQYRDMPSESWRITVDE